MREIKFRGYCDKDSEWRFGLYVSDGKHYEILTAIDGTDGKELYGSPVDPETVCQFTGLKDCGGDEIYEGDVIEIRFFDDFSNDCVTVDYEEDDPSIYTAKVHWDCAGYWLFSEKDATWFFPQSLDDYANIKVIGNIYENPELLEPAEC